MLVARAAGPTVGLHGAEAVEQVGQVEDAGTSDAILPLFPAPDPPAGF